MTVHPIRDSIEQSLDRARHSSSAAVFTKLFEDEARLQANAADRVGSLVHKVPTLGIPVTVKDNIDLAGHITTAGSKLLAKAPAAETDSPVAQRLRQAGLIIMGHTNMTEFAFSGLGLNPHYGTPRNPAFPDENRIPGGSSSGAAVSVALDISPVAIGTDTGGSIRIPAAFCGLTGYKPSARAISRTGVLPLSTTLDSVGVIAHQVSDCATIFDIMRDFSPDPRPNIQSARIKLGLVENYVTDAMQPHVANAIEKAVAVLADAGVAVERITLPELEDLPSMTKEANFSSAEAFQWHSRLIESEGASHYDPRVLARILAGKTMTAPAYVKLLADRQSLIGSVAAATAGLDALLWPTVPIIAPTFDELVKDEDYHAVNMLVLRNSSIANMLDGCAISLPCPLDGAPVGLTLATLNGQDDHLLSIAIAVERILKEPGQPQAMLHNWFSKT